jgi:hypothetical protein
MILVVVLGAWLSVFLCEKLVDDLALYYLTSSVIFSAATIGSFYVWLKNRSRVIFAYIMVNFIAAIFNFLISTPLGYDVYSVIYFMYFQKVMAVVELLALIHGGVDALLLFRSRFDIVSSGGVVRGASVDGDGSR